MLQVLVLGFLSQSVSGLILPTLPQAQVDTSMPVVNGNSFVVSAGGNLQAALDAAAAADHSKTHEVVLQAGATFNGSFYLRARADATGWIIVRSSQSSSLADGVRVSPTQSANMAKIQAVATDSAPLRADSGAVRYRLIGLEITTAPVAHQYELFVMGQQSNGIINTGYLIVDRCYLHGSDSQELRRGVHMDSHIGHTAVIDSHIDNCHETGADSQAISIIENVGPVKISNNFLQGAGESFISGGSDTLNASLVPKDLTITRNHISLNPNWRNTTSWSVKTLIEFKNAKRVLMEGNLLENLWPGDHGFAWRITPRNDYGNNPWTEVSDLTIRYNITRHVARGFNFFGSDNSTPSSSMPTQRVLIENNLWYDMGGSWTSADAGNSFWSWVNGGPYKADSVVFRHNTVINAPYGYFLSTDDSGQTNFIFADNIIHHGDYGVFRTGGAIGTAALDASFLSYTFTNNVMAGVANAGVSMSAYPAGNLSVNSFSDIGFVNLAQNDYRLASNSPYKAGGIYQASDGKDMGCDIDTLLAVQAGVYTPPPPPPPPNLCGNAVCDAGETSVSCSVDCPVVPPPPPPPGQQSPYAGVAAQVPGTIQVENFDLGGEGLAYHDAVVGNSGNIYRTAEDVDIIAGASADDYRIWNFEIGEWLEYSVVVAQSGTYTAELLASSGMSTGAFHLEVDDVDVTGSIAVPNTGAWQNYSWLGAIDIQLSAGPHVVKLVADQQYFNIDALRFTFVAPPPPVSVCGDGTCSADETAVSCPTDCSVPPPTGNGSYSGNGVCTQDANGITHCDLSIDGAGGCAATASENNMLALLVVAGLLLRIHKLKYTKID